MLDQTHDRAEPAHNVELEQALLGAVLINEQAFGVASATVGAEDFFEPLHQALWAEMGRLIAEGRKVTVGTLRAAFPEGNIPTTNLSFGEYIARLASEAVTVVNAPSYAQGIRDYSVMRQIIGIGHDLRDHRMHLTAPDLALKDAWERLDALRGQGGEKTDRAGGIADLCQRMMSRLEDIREKRIEPAITTGLRDLDRQLAGGYHRGRLYVFAGRPGAGKTVLMTSSARRVARMSGCGVLIHSLEIDEIESTARLISDEMARTGNKIPYRSIVSGDIEPHDIDPLSRAQARVAKLPIHLDCTGGLSIADIEARVRLRKDRFACTETPLGVVFIDYLGLIRRSDRYRGNKVDELGEIAQACKTMARREHIAVVLLAQLNRSVESREDKRPTMADLRASGEIEEHADVIGLIYRAAYYDARDPKVRAGDPEVCAVAQARSNDLELILDKNRLGSTVPVSLWCDVAHSAVDDRAMEM